jgi:tRNA1Val (adenine37-N6)-methyltransferase
MANSYFEFKQFRIDQERSAMKVTTDSVILGAWIRCESATTILDIGTGTGLLALMLAQKSSAMIDGVEIDEGACRDAELNFKKSIWNERLTIIVADFHEYALSYPGQYDVLVSNPPYFENSLKAQSIQKTIARHTDSLPFDKLLAGVHKLMAKEGAFYVILPFEAKHTFIEEAQRQNLYYSAGLVIRPTIMKPANRIGMKFEKNDKTPVEETLVIRDENLGYSEAYRLFTSDYYLSIR